MCVGKVRCAMKKLIKAFILFCTVIPLFLLQTSVLAESIPKTVPLSGVYDPNGYLSQEAVEKVATFNWAHTNADEKRAVKLAIVIVNNLDGEINSICV